MTLLPVSTQTVTVNFGTANGTATAGSDYVAASGTLTFAPGVSTRPISVIINGGMNLEATETFSVTAWWSGQRRPRHGGWHRHHPQRAATITVVARHSGEPPLAATRRASRERHPEAASFAFERAELPRPRRPH